MTEAERRYLKVEEVAHQLSLTESAVYKMCRRGEIPSVKFGKAVRIPVDGLRRYEQLLRGELQPTYLGDPDPPRPGTLEEQLDEFGRTAGTSPEEWIDRWRRDEILDTPENARIAIHALALRDASNDRDREDPATSALTSGPARSGAR